MYRYLFIKKVPVILYAILAPASALCSVVTAAAMAAAAFSLLAAFLRQEGNLRTFTFVGNLSVMFCLAAAADGVGGDWAKAPLFLGCALVLSVFLFLSREHPVPLPEEEKPDPKAPAAEEA